jgi:hypothetical protein
VSIPDAPVELTAEEQAQLADPHFHPYERCGKLAYRPIMRPKAIIRRYFCIAHEVYVDMNGWTVGHSYGTSSQAMNKQSSV